MDVLTLLLLGFERQELTTAVGTIAGIASVAIIVGVLALALAPQLSTRWAEHLGVDGPVGGPDPVDVVPGRSEPVSPDGGSAGGHATADELVADADPTTDSDSETDAPSVAPDPAE